MTPLYIIPIVLIAIIALGIIFKAVKLAFKIAGGIILLVLLTTAVFGFFAYQDYKAFQETEEPTLLLLHDEDAFLAGASIEEGKEIRFLTEEELTTKNLEYEGDIEAFTQESFRTIIMEKELLENVTPETMEIENENVSKEEIFTILESETATNELINVVNEENVNFELPVEFGEDGKLKGAIFMTTLANSLKNSSNFKELISGYKGDFIIVEPESALFKLIKLIPTNLIEKVGEKADVQLVQEEGST